MNIDFLEIAVCRQNFQLSNPVKSKYVWLACVQKCKFIFDMIIF